MSRVVVLEFVVMIYGPELIIIQRGEYFSWIGFALDDVENTDVATLFSWGSTDHTILRLEKTTHDVQYRSLTDCFCLDINMVEEDAYLLDLFAGKWCIGSHEIVTSWSWN